MSATVTIDDALFERLAHVAAMQGQDVNHYAVSVLESAVTQDEDPDAAFTEEQRDAVREGVRRGMTDIAEGRFRTLEELKEDKWAWLGVLA